MVDIELEPHLLANNPHKDAMGMAIQISVLTALGEKP